jgi:ribosomal-protein-alanine N-acetyltransferase
VTVETAFTSLPTLHTQRLTLRPIRPEDEQALFSIFSDAETMQFYGAEPHAVIERTRETIEHMKTAYESRKGLNWAVTFNGDETAIGSLSFHQFACKFKRVEVGYVINRTHWGHGIASEAVHAMLDFGFHDLGIHRVEAIIDDANIASSKLLLKLGFVFEGKLRERYLLGDTMMDEWMYGLLKSDWLQHVSQGT